MDLAAGDDGDSVSRYDGEGRRIGAQPEDPADLRGERRRDRVEERHLDVRQPLSWLVALVAVIGWVVLNRTTFGRRTFAVGGNPEAARLAGVNVKRHTVALYAILGMCCGIAAVMIVARTTTGSSTHGTLYELDAIAAVVIGGTLLSGGRGTIVGTVFGVLIFTTLSNVFTLNNLSSSAQSVAKGLIIVVAVLLQQRLAARSNSGSP